MCTYTFYFSVSSSALLRLSCLIEKEGKKKKINVKYWLLENFKVNWYFLTPTYF